MTRWMFVVLAVIVLLVACAPQPLGEVTQPSGECISVELVSQAPYVYRIVDQKYGVVCYTYKEGIGCARR
jgi:hypothetical protein